MSAFWIVVMVFLSAQAVVPNYDKNTPDSVFRNGERGTLQLERWSIASEAGVIDHTVNDNTQVGSIHITNITSAGLIVALDQSTRLGMVKKKSELAFQVPSGPHKIAVNDEMLGSEHVEITVKTGETLHLVATRTVKGLKGKLSEVTSLLGSQKKRNCFYHLEIDDKPLSE